jgi:hypothetical protein
LRQTSETLEYLILLGPQAVAKLTLYATHRHFCRGWYIRCPDDEEKSGVATVYAPDLSPMTVLVFAGMARRLHLNWRVDDVDLRGFKCPRELCSLFRRSGNISQRQHEGPRSKSVSLYKFDGGWLRWISANWL